MSREVINTPFGPMKCFTDESIPRDRVVFVTPGEKVEFVDERGNFLREEWIRKPSIALIINIGVPE